MLGVNAINEDQIKVVQRRSLLFGSSAILIAPLAANPQPRGKTYRIGYIQTATPEEQQRLTKAFDDGLRELGYVEGQDIVVERRFAWGKQELLPDLAAELVRLDVTFQEVVHPSVI